MIRAWSLYLIMGVLSIHVSAGQQFFLPFDEEICLITFLLHKSQTNLIVKHLIVWIENASAIVLMPISSCLKARYKNIVTTAKKVHALLFI